MLWDTCRQIHVGNVCCICNIIIVRHWRHSFAYFGVGRNLNRRTEHYVNLAVHSSMELLERPNTFCIVCLSAEDSVVWRPEQ